MAIQLVREGSRQRQAETFIEYLAQLGPRAGRCRGALLACDADGLRGAIPNPLRSERAPEGIIVWAAQASAHGPAGTEFADGAEHRYTSSSDDIVTALQPGLVWSVGRHPSGDSLLVFGKVWPAIRRSRVVKYVVKVEIAGFHGTPLTGRCKP